MSGGNRAVLEEANVAITEGNYEGSLALCTDDSEWTFVGERTLVGKEAIRQWMAVTYRDPPKFVVTRLIAEGEYVVALGHIRTKDEDGKATRSSYCDVWRVRDGKLSELRAFVIASESNDELDAAPPVIRTTALPPVRSGRHIRKHSAAFAYRIGDMCI